VARDLVERLDESRRAEVEELHAPVALHEHVRRLEVAVDDAPLVEVVERVRDRATIRITSSVRRGVPGRPHDLAWTWAGTPSRSSIVR
jgi:hypothetical protein